MAIYDYACPECGNLFEAMIPMASRHTAPCTECGATAEQVIVNAPMLDPKMGVDKDFSTAAAKWDRSRWLRATGRMKDSNNHRLGTNADVERDAHALRKRVYGD